MSERARKLLQDAMERPVPERAELAADLLASLDGEPDADVEAAWASEIERRAREALANPTMMSLGRPCAPSCRPDLDPESRSECSRSLTPSADRSIGVTASDLTAGASLEVRPIVQYCGGCSISTPLLPGLVTSRCRS